VLVAVPPSQTQRWAGAGALFCGLFAVFLFCLALVFVVAGALGAAPAVAGALAFVAGFPGVLLGVWWLQQELHRRKEEEANNREYHEARREYRRLVAAERKAREERWARAKEQHAAAMRTYHKAVEAETLEWQRRVVAEVDAARRAHEAGVRRWEQAVQPMRAEADRRRQAHRAAERALTDAERVWQAAADRIARSFDDARAVLERARSAYQAADGEHQREHRALQARARELQFHQYLDSQLIEDADIPQIKEGRKAILASFGIETALDVERSAIEAIRGFGEVLTGNLLAWRRSVEQAFVFDPAKGVPPHEVQALEQRFRARKGPLETSLSSGGQQLQGIVSRGYDELRILNSQIEQRAAEFAQAQADLRAIPAGL
jgi:hypothetical protein